MTSGDSSTDVPERDPVRSSKATDPPGARKAEPRSGRSTRAHRVRERWEPAAAFLVKYRTPLVLFPMVTLLVVAAVMGGQMMLSQPSDEEAAAQEVVCWDKSVETSIGDCGLPQSGKGLRWVFPTFATKTCKSKPVENSAKSKVERVSKWLCKRRANGAPVDITYNQLVSTRQMIAFYDQQFEGIEREELSRGNGVVDRFRWQGERRGKFVAVVAYIDFPYSVEIRSKNFQARNQALRNQVRFRAGDRIVTRPITPEELKS